MKRSSSFLSPNSSILFLRSMNCFRCAPSRHRVSTRISNAPHDQYSAKDTFESAKVNLLKAADSDVNAFIAPSQAKERLQVCIFHVHNTLLQLICLAQVRPATRQYLRSAGDIHLRRQIALGSFYSSMVPRNRHSDFIIMIV